MEEDLASDAGADSGTSAGPWSGQLTEEERLAWKEKRQKRDKLSDAMGQYLLKGYRMLDANCQTCTNILMQTRDGTNICLNCDEVEASAISNKHSTATSDVMPAQSLPQPQSHTHHSEAGSKMNPSKTPPKPQSHTHQTEAGSKTSPSKNPPNQGQDAISTGALVPPEKAPGQSTFSGLTTKTLHMSEEALVSKLQWAAQELAGSTSVDQSAQLCLLIKSCTDALQSVRVLQQQTVTAHAGNTQTID